MKERFKLVPGVALVLKRGNEILLQRRYGTGWEDGNYSVAGGHLDGGETILQAMIREAKKEIGIILDKGGLKLVHVMHSTNPDKPDLHKEIICFYVEANKWEGEPEILEHDKCDDLSWFDANNLPSNMVTIIKYALDKIREGKIYSEYGFGK